jgi:DNA polymerase-3 subunit gamma/tau
LIACLHRIAIAQVVPDGVDNNLGDTEKIKQFASRITAEDLQLFYQTALIGRKDLPLNPDARAGLEMVLLRMLLFRPTAPANSSDASNGSNKTNTSHANNISPQRGAALNAASTSAGRGGGELAPEQNLQRNQGGSEARQKVLAAKALLTDSAVKSNLKVTKKPVTPGVTNSVEGETFVKAEAVVKDVPVVNDVAVVRDIAVVRGTDRARADNLDAVEEPQTGGLDTGDFSINDEWTTLVERLGIDGNLLNMARNCSLESKASNQYLLHLDRRHEALLNNERVKKLEEAIARALDSGVTLNVNLSEPTRKTPDQLSEEVNQKKLLAATTIINSDPVVAALKNRFQAVVDPKSIRSKL